MKYILSRFNHDINWISDYTDDCILYDRSEDKVTGNPEMLVIPVKNVGSDISDKFKFIIENYDNLPDLAVYTKANLFKYISKEEFDKVKDNKTFTPLLTQNHRVYSDERGKVCYYRKGLYYERNDYWYLNSHPARFTKEIIEFFGMDKRKYNAFAPGSNYILPKENIFKHPIETYIKLKSYLDWDTYPGDCQLMERNLYYLWL